MRIARIVGRVGCLLLRRKWFVIAAVVAALFVSPVVVTRDPEIVVLNAIGLGFALFQIRQLICALIVGRAMAARQRAQRERIEK